VKRCITAIILAAFIVPAAAFAGKHSAPTKIPGATVLTSTPKDWRFVLNGNAAWKVMFDTRSKAAFNKSRMQNGIWMPPSHFNAEKVLSIVKKNNYLSSSERYLRGYKSIIYVYGEDKHDLRPVKLVKKLVAAGYKHVLYIRPGMKGIVKNIKRRLSFKGSLVKGHLGTLTVPYK